MTSLQPPSIALAHAVIGELLATGTRDIVLCPGSRSVPLAYAAYRAEQDGRVRLHVRTDERAAGFLALGLARTTGQITPVIVTSGSAVANLHPAVVEADASGVPLLVLSANRPLELIGTGANQTTTQQHMFGPHVRRMVSLPGGTLPHVDERELRAARSWMCRAIAAAATGPVHVDVPLAPPLVPTPDAPLPQWPHQPHTTVHAHPATTGAPLTLDRSERILVIAGADAPHVPALDGLVTLAEPTAAAPEMLLHPLAAQLLRAGELGGVSLTPQHMVVVGRPTLHREVLKLLAAHPCPITVLTDSPTTWADEHFTADTVCSPDALDTTGEISAQWVEICSALGHLGAEAVRREVSAAFDPQAGDPTGLAVAAVVADSLDAGDVLIAGASQPIRDLAFTGLPREGVRVVSNRGTSGIDGVLSTAVGVSLAVAAETDEDGFPPVTPTRCVALVGDLTFLHDASALAIAPEEPRPANLTIIIANDHGGGIFESLEPGAPQHRDWFERIVATGHEVDFAALCHSYGVTHQLVELRDLPTLLAATVDPDPLSDLAATGIQVLEVRCQRAGRRGESQRLAAGMDVQVPQPPTGEVGGDVAPRRRGVDIPDIGGDTLGPAVEWPPHD